MKKLEKILLFLTILFLPTQLGKHFWPLSSFIYSLPIDYLSPTVYFWDILVVMLFAAFALQKKPINRQAVNLFLFFILTQTLSLINALNLGAGLVRLEQYLIAGLFGVYIASTKSKIFLPLAIAVCFEGFLAIAQLIKGGSLGFWILGERTFSLSTAGIAKFDYHGIQILRPYATFPHPNVLSAFMLVAALILRKKALSILAVAVTALTVSRTGLIAAVMLFRDKKILLLASLLLLPVLYTRFSSLLNFDSLALTRRGQLSQAALALWFKSPFLGVGLNNFIPQAADLLLAGPSRFLQPAHNIILLALAETGIIGLIGLIGLIGYPILKRLNLLIWGIILFLGLFDHYWLTLPQGYRLLFLVWGLSLSRLSGRL